MTATTDEKGNIARKEEERKKAFDTLQWFDLGRGAGKDEFLRCRLLRPGASGPWLVVTLVERRSYSTKAKAELTNETVVADAITRSMIVIEYDPRELVETPRRTLTEGAP